MNRKLIILLVIVAIVIGLMIYKQSSKPSQQKAKERHIETTVVKEDIPQKVQQPVKVSLSKPKENTNTKVKITQSQPLSHKKEVMYETISLEEAITSSKPRKRVKPLSAIQINEAVIASLKKNDTLVLPDIEGIDYDITISNTHKNNDGSISTTGSFIDEGITYTTTITHSNSTSFINIATPNGVYEIETNNGIGFTYKTSDIRKQLQTSHQNDMILLPIPKRPKTQ